MKKLLLTGAAGRIGSRLIEELIHDYDLTLAEKDVSALKEWKDKGCKLKACDITHFEECLEACEGMDTVIHGWQPFTHCGLRGSEIGQYGRDLSHDAGCLGSEVQASDFRQ